MTTFPEKKNNLSLEFQSSLINDHGESMIYLVIYIYIKWKYKTYVFCSFQKEEHYDKDLIFFKDYKLQLQILNSTLRPANFCLIQMVFLLIFFL